MAETEQEIAALMRPVAQMNAIDGLAKFNKECGPIVTGQIAQGQLHGIFLWLSVTMGPEAAAEIAYRFADDLATRHETTPFAAKKEMKP